MNAPAPLWDRPARQTPHMVTETQTMLHMMQRIDLDTDPAFDAIKAAVREGSFHKTYESGGGLPDGYVNELTCWTWFSALCNRDDAVLLLGAETVLEIEGDNLNPWAGL